jgi:hypothetical protein
MTRPSFEGASNAADPPVPPEPAGEGAELVEVFLLNATRTSAGPGPGVKLVPPAEASTLVAAKVAVPGEAPPRGWPG